MDAFSIDCPGETTIVALLIAIGRAASSGPERASSRARAVQRIDPPVMSDDLTSWKPRRCPLGRGFGGGRGRLHRLPAQEGPADGEQEADDRGAEHEPRRDPLEELELHRVFVLRLRKDRD